MENKYLSVTKLNTIISSMLEEQFSNIYFYGEISQLTKASSGHIYLTLKDKNSVIPAVIWRSTAQRLNFDIISGQSVLCSAKANLYPPSGKFQMILNSVKLAGEGELTQKFELLKEKLSKEGLFDISRKREIPYFPKKIGVVSSKTGAVIHDIMNRIKERMPAVQVVIYNAKVQGVGSLQEVISGIEYFNNQNDIDLVILARGGGSLADLWTFNEENLVRSIFSSKIPIISAIGHQTDVTLSDLVADFRAATPTAAAEKAVPDRAELLNSLTGLKRRLNNFDYWFYPRFQVLDNLEVKFNSLYKDLFTKLKERINNFYKLLKASHPKNNLINKKNQILKIQNDLNKNFQVLINKNKELIKNFEIKNKYLLENIIKNQKVSLENMSKKLELLNIEKFLDKGFAIVKYNNKIITDPSSLKAGDSLELQIKKTNIITKIEKVNNG